MSYYDRGHLPKFGSIAQGNPVLAEKFFDYYGAVFADGAMTVREKSLTALAVAHAVQCPYCIDAYTSGSMEAGADLEQLTEAVHVAALLRAEAVVTHGMQMLGQASQAEMAAQPMTSQARGYYDEGHLRDLPRFKEVSGKLGEKYFDYAAHNLQDGALSALEKRLIAVACAHALQSPYSIAAHSAKCLELGGTVEAMTEAVHVATAIRGGASLIHGLQMLDQVKKTTM